MPVYLPSVLEYLACPHATHNPALLGPSPGAPVPAVAHCSPSRHPRGTPVTSMSALAALQLRMTHIQSHATQKERINRRNASRGAQKTQGSCLLFDKLNSFIFYRRRTCYRKSLGMRRSVLKTRTSYKYSQTCMMRGKRIAVEVAHVGERNRMRRQERDVKTS